MRFIAASCTALLLAGTAFAAGAQSGRLGPPRSPSAGQAGQDGGLRQLSAEQRAELRRQLSEFSRRPGKGS